MSRPKVPKWLAEDVEAIERHYSSRSGEQIWELQRYSTTRALLRLILTLAKQIDDLWVRTGGRTVHVDSPRGGTEQG